VNGDAPAALPLRQPRDFCGAAYPWPLVRDLTDGVDVVACYLVRDKKRLETRQNKPYLKLVLGDGSGEIGANIWDEIERWDPLCPEAGVVGVRGRATLYQDRLQLKIGSIEPLDPLPDDLERLVPASPIDRQRLEKQLDSLIASVKDDGYRALLRRCVGRSTPLGLSFRVHPAAMRNHHAYLCGLLEHSVSVASTCSRLAAHYREQGIDMDRDLLVTGALLHDIGKVRELEALPSSGYTTEGQLLGHILLGMQIVEREAIEVPAIAPQRRMVLQHLIASHQGRPEWESPKKPQLAEALVLHYADDLDAKLNLVRSMLTDVRPGEWTAYERSMERSFYRPTRAEAESDLSADPSDSVELLIDLFRS
jgi:3'-5' exoribonuclease